MFNMGFWEIFAIAFAVLLLFGAKRIPELAQGIGKGMKEFKKAIKDVQDDISIDETNDKEKK